MPEQFLPPDPRHTGPPAPTPPAARPVFVPPHSTLASPPRPQNERAVTGLALGCAGLGLLVFTMGVLFVVTLPCSVAAWVLGVQARRREHGRDQGTVAVILGIVGVVLGLVAAAVWIAVLAWTDWSATDVRVDDDGQLQFDVLAPIALLERLA